ncbi:MAG: transporter substrate-binding domain-containing protein [bacterium]|nr:transporter substrate-binding domain-containing protein [bacterium]
MIKKFVVYMTVLLVFLVLPGIVGCSKEAAEDTTPAKEVVKKASLIDKITTRGTLVIGTTDDYPPYEFRMFGDEKKIVGIDIDIATAIAAKLGVKLEVKHLMFNDLLKHLGSDSVDMVIAALSPTVERKKNVDFSRVYYKADLALLIRLKDNETIKTIADLEGKKLGVQVASVQMELAMKHISGAVLVEKDEVTDLVAGLNDGSVDAVILEKPVAESYIIKNKELTSKPCHIDMEKSRLGAAIAVKKGQKVFLDKINTILTDLENEKKIAEFVEKSKILTAEVVR